MEKVPYKGWPNCCRLANREIELIATTDVGPRIMRLGFVGGENEFKEFDGMLGQTGGEKWKIYGGHRLWHAPEIEARTYAPDNGPLKLEDHGRFVRLVQPTEATTGIQKEIDIALDPDAPRVTVTHRLRNTGLWAVELAPWALSVMAGGGKAILPLPPRIPFPKQLLPSNSLTLWSYVDMSDARWTWGKKYILLRQDPQVKEPQKIGLRNLDGWAAYANGGRLFVKRFPYQAGAAYPDFGCNFETYTNAAFLEMESLGPLAKLPPGATVEHAEHWFLFRDVPAPAKDEDVDRHVLPKIESCTK